MLLILTAAIYMADLPAEKRPMSIIALVKASCDLSMAMP